MTSTDKPHDKFFRSSMQNYVIAQSFFQQYLPQSLLDGLDLTSLTLENSTYIDDTLQETISDLVFRCCYRDGKTTSPAKVVLLVEHQSTPHRLMPFRVYHYMFNIVYPSEIKMRIQ